MNALQRFSLTAISVAAISAIVSCSQQGNTQTVVFADLMAEATAQDGRACIRTNDIRGYAMDQNRINIDAGRRYYVATTLYHCQNIDMAPRALFESRFSEACGGSSYITTREGRCPIQRIFEFDSRDEALSTSKKILDQVAIKNKK